MENGIQLIFDLSQVTTYQPQTAGASERLVKTSPLPEKEPDLKETEAHLSEKYSEYSRKSPKKIVPNGLSTKMLRECLAAIEGGTSEQYSLKWENWGMIQNGNCLTQKISEFRKTESECILSDILEAEVESKYFLSKEQTEKIVFQSR